MKTFIRSLVLLSLTSLLLAQVDSTQTEPIVPEESVEAVAVETTSDSTETPAEAVAELEAAPSDSMATELTEDVLETADSLFTAEADSVTIEEPEMILVQNTPEPVVLAGLTNLGPLYYWSNDGIEALEMESLSYVSIMDPELIAIKASACNDIVCHLLASDSSGVDYVLVSAEDSSDFKIYNTVTMFVVLQAPGDQIKADFEAFLLDQAGTDYIAATPEADAFVGPILTDDAMIATTDPARAARLKIKHRQFRSMDKFADNPANLARDFEGNLDLNLLPDMKVSVHNSLLTPSWYTDWWTIGGIWDADMKNDYLSTITNQDMALNVTPDFTTLFGVRVGRFGLNISGKSHIKIVVPGDILGLPMQDILLNEPVENGGFEMEAIPFVLKTNLSYAQPVPTPFGEVKVGVGLNIFEALGYARLVSNNFTITTTEDSVFVSASGEGWATQGGIEGKPDDLQTDDLDIASTASNIGIGLDIGAIMDLQPLIHQDVEVQVSLKNLGASYKWSGISHESWSTEIAMPAPGTADLDSVEQYQVDENTVISDDEELSIDVPAVFSLGAIYQPIPQVILGLGIEKAFTDEVSLGYGPDLAFTYQLNLYPTPWIDVSYYRQTLYGDPVHTFGTGFHFGFLETGLTMSFINGLNEELKGVGFGFRSSLHF